MLLNFLEKSTRPDIVNATHKCAQLSQYPRAPHGAAVKNLVKYLAATKIDGLVLDSQTPQSLEVYTDSDFS